MVHLEDAQYAELLHFRNGLRRFLRWSELQAREAGLTPAQHQLMLAVRGHVGAPTISDLASHLLLRHHSTVELVDRAEEAGLVRRKQDPDDHRVVHVRLTPSGLRRLAALSAAHLEELARLSPSVRPIWAGLS